MTIVRIPRRLLPALLLCVLAATALGQPAGVWTPTPSRPGNAAHQLYAAHFVSGQSGIVAGANSSQTSAVMYRTTDGGTTWSAVTVPGSPTAINDIYFLDGDLKGFVVGNDNYFAVTTDGGATWTNRTLAASTWGGTLSDLQAVYFMSETRGWVVGRLAGGNGPRLARTSDGGLTWTQTVMTGAANNLHDIDFFDLDHGLAVGTGNPTRKSMSTDGGTTWQANADMGALQSESVSMYGLDAIDGSAVAFAAGGKNFASPIYPVVRRTTDYGATWTNLITNTSPVTGLPKPASDVIALGPNVVYVAGQDAKIIRSVDGGTNWTPETVNPFTGTTPDLRKFSLTSDNYLWVVGTSGAVLRTRLVPDASFAPAPPISFGAFCPGDGSTQTLTIGNTGLGVLNVFGASIIQPAGGTVQFTLVLPAVARVWPKTTEPQRISVVVGPGTPAGTHLGELTLSTNDENGAGTDAFRRIPLAVTALENGVAIDSAVARDVGAVRLGALKSVSLIGLLRNASTTCLAPIDTVYLARGLDFRLVAPFVGRDTLRPLERRNVFLEFSPSRICARYDTLVVRQSGGAFSLRIPIVGTGVEPTYATIPADTLRFGSVQIGASGSATLRLVNRKPGSCLDRTALRSLRITGPNATEFTTSVTITPGTSFIPADGELPIAFTATPGAIGPRIAYALIEHELSPQPDVVVLLVNGTDAELSTIDEVVFPVTGVGQRRDTSVAAALRNLGVSTVTLRSAIITGSDRGAFTLVAPQTPRAIARGASDSIVLGFTPDRVGMFSATLEIVSDRGTTYSIRLSGEGADASGAIGRDPWRFAPTSVGACSEELVERFVVNTGRVPLIVRGLSLVAHPRGVAGDETRFSVVAPVIPPEVTIAPGDSLAVLLRFCPLRLGEHLAALAVATNIPGAPLLDTLIGEGVRARILATDSMAFAPTRVGTQRDSAVDPLVINRSDSPLEITALSLVGGDSADFAIVLPTSPQSVAAGEALPATLRFLPRARGTRRTTLRIVSSQGTHDMSLSGIGIYPLMTVTGNPAPRVRVGSTGTFRYHVENDGDDVGRIDSVRLTGSPAFAITASGDPATLLPGGSFDVVVDFSPATPCEHPAVLTVSGEGTTATALVGDTAIAITGIGSATRLSAKDDTVDFGSVSVGARRDSVLDGFVANRWFTDPSLLCVDPVGIDAVTLSGTDMASFEIVAIDPRPVLPAGDGLALTVRFAPKRAGTHVAHLEIAFDGMPDSLLRVELVGNADELPEIPVGLSFGADHVTKPGDVIRVPITLAGAVTAASIDSLVVDIAYPRSLLRLERVVTTGSTAAVTSPADLSSVAATSSLTLSAPDGLAAGTVAELEFSVLLGDVLDGDVYADTAYVPGRSDVRITGDSANVSIAAFCNARGRLIGFGGALLVKATPNPASDALTIEYTLPARGPARLALYDASGRAVTTILDGVSEAGTYSIELDTRALAAGTYYCRLTAGRFDDAAVIRLRH